MWREFSCRWSIAIALLIVIASAPVSGQISMVVAEVSQSQYESYHFDVESMGLGRYGGPAYNMGFRNRDGWAGAGSLGNQETRLYLQSSFAALGLNVTTQGNYRNVIGELPGVTTPERIFVVGGHYDHVSGDRPGGDDNASGTAGVLELARVLSQFQFDSTIRFIGFNAEEDGLLGSEDYVSRQVVAHSENVVGMISLDMILRPGWDSGGHVIDLDLGTRTSHAPSVAWAQKFRQAAATYVPALVVDNTTFGVNGGSDQDPFVTAGYPGLLAIENTAQEIWGGSNIYYHGFQDASDRLANNPASPSGVTYDYGFATNVIRATAGLIAQEARLLVIPDPCDFDLNGACNIGDLNALFGQGPLANGVPVSPGINDEFDLTGDGVLDNNDADEWLAAAATKNGFGSPYKRGDANLDGTVDGVDFTMWNASKFTATLRWDEGNFDGDALTDGIDFTLWNAHKFTSSDGASAVPEPGSGILLCAGLVLLGTVRVSGGQ